MNLKQLQAKISESGVIPNGYDIKVSKKMHPDGELKIYPIREHLAFWRVAPKYKPVISIYHPRTLNVKFVVELDLGETQILGRFYANRDHNFDKEFDRFNCQIGIIHEAVQIFREVSFLIRVENERNEL